MYSKEQLLEMIANDNSSVRYAAVEWLRVSQTSYPEYIQALEKATHDLDPGVAQHACMALETEVHRKMAVEMGMVAPIGNLQSSPLVVEPKTQTLDEVVQPAPTAAEPVLMLKEIRSWGTWGIVLGAISLVASGFLDPTWGILLILVGIASLIFKTSSMLIIYGVTMGWAALWNMRSMSATWVLFSFFQLFISVRIFLNYRRFRKDEAIYLANSSAENQVATSTRRAGLLFPWLGITFGSLSIVGYATLIFLVFAIAFSSTSNVGYPRYLGLLEGILVNMGVLGFSLGLSSLLSRFRPKAAGIIALVTGLLTMLVFIGFLLLNRFG